MAATALAAFTQARDFLLKHRTDYTTAYRDFQWPALTEFNWALDYFDAMARGNDAAAFGVGSTALQTRRRVIGIELRPHVHTPLLHRHRRRLA